MKNKKAQLGLDTVKSMMLAFLTLAVIAIAIILAISSVTDSAENIDKTTTIISNESTVAVVDDTGSVTIPSATGFRNCLYSPTLVLNDTDGVEIPASNYSVTDCTITWTGVADGGNFNGTVWRLWGSYKYTSESSANINRNMSSSLATFFNNSGTIFSILIVVVIILAITIIIVAVGRFSGTTRSL